MLIIIITLFTDCGERMSAKERIGASDVTSMSPPYSVPGPARTAAWAGLGVVWLALLVQTRGLASSIQTLCKCLFSISTLPCFEPAVDANHGGLDLVGVVPRSEDEHRALRHARSQGRDG